MNKIEKLVNGIYFIAKDKKLTLKLLNQLETEQEIDEMLSFLENNRNLDFSQMSCKIYKLSAKRKGYDLD